MNVEQFPRRQSTRVKLADGTVLVGSSAMTELELLNTHQRRVAEEEATTGPPITLRELRSGTFHPTVVAICECIAEVGNAHEDHDGYNGPLTGFAPVY